MASTPTSLNLSGSDIVIPTVDFPIRPNATTTSTPAGASTPWSSAANALSGALGSGSLLGGVTDASGIPVVQSAIGSVNNALSAGSNWFTSQLSRYVAIALGLIILAAAVFSFDKVQEVARPIVKAGAKAGAAAIA